MWVHGAMRPASQVQCCHCRNQNRLWFCVPYPLWIRRCSYEVCFRCCCHCLIYSCNFINILIIHPISSLLYDSFHDQLRLDDLFLRYDELRHQVFVYFPKEQKGILQVAHYHNLDHQNIHDSLEYDQARPNYDNALNHVLNLTRELILPGFHQIS